MKAGGRILENYATICSVYRRMHRTMRGQGATNRRLAFIGGVFTIERWSNDDVGI